MTGTIPTLFKNSFGGLARAVWILAGVQFINRCGSMVLLFMTVYGTHHLHFSVQQVGVVMGLFGIGSLTGVYISGKLVDKLGYYAIMLWSLILSGLLLILLGQLHQFLAVCVGTFFVSACGEAFRPANMAAIGIYSSAETQTRSVSLNRLAINVGFTIGPAVGGFLASYNYELLFWVDGLTCLAAALSVKLFLKSRNSRETIKANLKVESTTENPYKDKVFIFFCLANVAYAIAFFQLIFILPLFYKDVQGLSEQHIGGLLAMNGIMVAAIEMVLIYKIEGRWTKLNFISLGAFILFVNYIFMPFFNSIFWLIIGMLLITFSEMFAMPFMSSFMMQRSNSSNRGQYSSLYSMSWSVAQIVSPLLASQIIAHFGYNYLWMLMAALCLAVTMAMRVMNQRSELVKN